MCAMVYSDYINTYNYTICVLIFLRYLPRFCQNPVAWIQEYFKRAVVNNKTCGKIVLGCCLAIEMNSIMYIIIYI